MSTTAKELLSIMKVRLAMQEAGAINPLPSAAAATQRLVTRLAMFSPDEEIRVECRNAPFHAQYIRQSTNEVLAEIWVSDET